MNYLIAKMIIERTDKDSILTSKILHEKKTSVINNIVLALIVVENDLDLQIIYKEEDSFIKEIKKSADNIRKVLQKT